MHYRRFHGTDTRISELGMGTWTLTTGWWGEYTGDEMESVQKLYVRNFDVQPYVESEAVAAE